MSVGEVNRYEWDIAPAAGRLGATVSSVTWSSSNPSIASLSSESLSDSKASVLAEALAVGCTTIKCAIVFSDGQKRNPLIHLKVNKPGC